MNDFEKIKNFLASKIEKKTVSDQFVMIYLRIFAMAIVSYLVNQHIVSQKDALSLFNDNKPSTNLPLKIAKFLFNNKRITIYDTCMLTCFLLKVIPPKELSFADELVVDSLCNNDMFFFLVENIPAFADTIVPDNAIDEFVYNIKRGIKNAKNTVKESEVVRKSVDFTVALLPFVILMIILILISLI